MAGTFEYYDIKGQVHILNANEQQTSLLLHEIEHLDGHNCTESYSSQTLIFIKNGKDEIYSHPFTKLE